MTLAGFWFIVLVVLWTGFFVLEGFDFGVGMLHGVVGRDEEGRTSAIESIGPVWDGNEVWLIVAIAGTFAAFPTWYATMLSGFYPLILLLLAGLIVRGVSFEFRAHAETARARTLWSAALTSGSVVIPLVLGIVLANLLHGVPIDATQNFAGGLADLLSPYALVTGVALTVLCLLHGAVFLAFRTLGELRARALRTARLLATPVAVLVVVWILWTRIGYGQGVLLSVAELVAVVAVVAAAVQAMRGQEGTAFAATSVTIAASIISIFDELSPRVMVSTLGAANDLTVENTASAPYALTVMTIVAAVLLPVVLVYQWWSYHVFRRRIGGPPPGSGDSSRPPGVATPAQGPRPATGTPRRPSADPGSSWSDVGPAFRLLGWLLGWAAAILLRRSGRPTRS